MRVTDNSVCCACAADACSAADVVKSGGVARFSRTPSTTSLDFFKISVQRSKKGMVALDGERWHSRTFRLFAQKYLDFTFTYEGIDWLGNYRYCRNNLAPRWSEYHRRYTLGRIYSWAECSALDNALFGVPLPVAHLVTLTVRHDVSGTYRSHKETVDKLRSGWSGVRCWLSRSGVRYLRVIEPGESNGYAHIHMVIIGGSDTFCEELIRRWLSVCPDSLRRGQNYQRVENIRNVGAYIAKYLCKSFEGDSSSKEYLHWLELCYRLRLRCFSMDARSSSYIHKKYLKAPSGVGVCQIRYDDDNIKTVEALSQSEKPLEDESKAQNSIVLCRSGTKGSDGGCSPTPHRSRGARGVKPSRMRVKKKSVRYIDK